MNDDFILDFNADDLPDASRYTVDDAINALPLPEGVIPEAVLYGLSDLTPDQLKQFRPVWQDLPTEQRLRIMQRIAEQSEADYLLDYAAFAKLGYQDEVSGVRKAAIDAGWTDESPDMLKRLMDIVQNDPADEVRETAVIEMGRFILMGELDEISHSLTEKAQQVLLDIINDPQDAPDVQRRALESIAYAEQRSEVAPLIEQAYGQDDALMKISAICAMGNSADERWAEIVLDELTNDEPAIVFEAVRAAGSLRLERAIAALKDYCYLDDDPQIQEAAVWSLGEIGTEDAVEVLEALLEHAEETDNEVLEEAVDEALEIAQLVAMAGSFDLLGDFGELLDDWDEDDLPQ